MMKVAVLGGGVTGLVASHLLSEKGHEVKCLEASPIPGGLCRSETIDGFVADRAGGHIIFSKDQEVLNYVLELLGDGGYHTSQRNTCIYYDHRYIQYPFENGLADLAKEDTFRALQGYIDAWHLRKTGTPEPTNFHDWCLWRFGEGICDLFMHPYNQKIWNVDLHELGIKWVSGRVPDAPIEDVLRSALGIRTEGYKHQSKFHYPMEGGFQAITDTLTKKLPDGVLQLETPCTSLKRGPDGKSWLVNGESFDRVISSVPLQELIKFLEKPPAEIEKSFNALDWTSLVTVFLALDKSDAPPHSWVYFPDDADGPQNRITWLSNYSPKNAPPGKSSIMAEVTYYQDAPGSDEEITEQVVKGLSDAGFFKREELLWSQTWHNKYAYILYRQGLEENLETVRDYCKSIDLDIVGRFGNYNYYNSDMCIRSAMDLVNKGY